MTTRELLQIVEIDLDFCSLTYGTGACTAVLGTTGPRKCYNGFATCQDRSNFTRSTLTLRFARNQAGLPKGMTIFPALQSVSTNPTKINPGGMDGKASALGKRARVTVNLKDFAYSDTLTDKYQAGRVDGTAQTDEGGYNPQDRGTFFGKWRRRFPYYNGRALRVLEGYVGDSLSAMRTRHYVITEFVGPDAGGNVQITAKDVLDLADNDKALCPRPSRGKIADDIGDGVGVAVALEPAGIGAEYATIGRASIGSEIVTFSRSGDTVTLLKRGIDGTDRAEHDAGDLFQECYRVDRQRIDEIAADLLENYAGVDPTFIPTSDWSDEIVRWMSSFILTTTIAKPTGVASLIGELSALGVSFWWDDVDQLIKLRANRPVDYNEAAPALTDTRDILADSTSVGDLHDQRLSQVYLWHGMLDYSASPTSKSNFARLAISADLVAEGANEYDESRVKQFFSRWVGVGDDSVAQAVVGRLLNRYRDTPRQLTFTVDISAGSSLDLADLVTITSRHLQNDTGASLPTMAQITAMEETVPGHRMSVTAQTFDFGGRFGFITENGRPDYGASSDAQRKKGTYIVGASLKFADDTGPYLIF